MEDRSPIYAQIADILAGKLSDGSARPHDKLPSENELCLRFNASRPTIRRALTELERDGMIYRVQGLGTFVAPYNGSKAFGFGGFTERCSELGIEPSSVVLQKQVVTELPAFFTEWRDIPVQSYPDNRYMMLERVRRMSGKPVSIETAFVPLALYPAAADEFDGQSSLYDYLRERYNTRSFRSDAIVQPYLLSESDEARSGIPAGTPMLESFLAVWSQTHQLLEYSHTLNTADFPLRFHWEK